MMQNTHSRHPRRVPTPPPVTPEGDITLFVDGFGVQLPEGVLEGTVYSDGDDIPLTTLGDIHAQYRDRLAANAG